MSVCRRGIDLLGTMNIGLNILQDIQSSFFRTFIHLPGKKQGDIAGDNNDGGIDYLGDNLFTVEIRFTYFRMIVSTSDLSVLWRKIQPGYDWHVIKVKHENSKYGNATIGNGLPALRCILSFCIDKVVGWVRNPDKKNHADIGAAIAAEHICLAVAVQGLGS